MANDNSRSSTRVTRLLFLIILLTLLGHIAVIILIFSSYSNTKSQKKSAQVMQKLRDLPDMRAGLSSYNQTPSDTQASVIYYQQPIIPEQQPSPTTTQTKQEIKSDPDVKAQVIPQKAISKSQPTGTGVQQMPRKAPTPTRPQNPFVPRFQNQSVAMLQKIGQGFVEHIRNDGGSDGITTHGTKKFASLENVKYISYLQQLAHHLQSAFKSDTSTFTLTHDEHIQIEMKLTLDKNGEIIDLQMGNAPTNRSIEQLLRTIVYRAAPFPHIPKSINQSYFVHNLLVRVDLSAGTHRSSWAFF